MYVKKPTKVALKFCFVSGVVFLFGCWFFFFFNLEDCLQTPVVRSMLNLCYLADLWECQYEIISTTFYYYELLMNVK